MHELAPLVGVFDYVAFKLAADGSLTLFGQVREPRVKTHVEEDAKKVPGVTRVLNRIEILPISPSDDNIRRAVYNSIYSQTGFSRYANSRRSPDSHHREEWICHTRRCCCDQAGARTGQRRRKRCFWCFLREEQSSYRESGVDGMESRSEDKCPGCGRALSEWPEEGFVQPSGIRYCCEGCAEGSGCTCAE